MDPDTLEYVDDGIIYTKANMDSALVIQANGVTRKIKHDIQTQNLFRRIVRKAESRGMVVNKGKTKILFVSDAQTYEPDAFIVDRDGTRIGAGKSMSLGIPSGLKALCPRSCVGAPAGHERCGVDPKAPGIGRIHQARDGNSLQDSGETCPGLLR